MKNPKALLLAAGIGSRLRPLTDNWPKCLMPIKGRSLLEYWLCTLKVCGIHDVLVNIHHHKEEVELFLKRKQFVNWVSSVYEAELLGTAGTLIENAEYFSDRPTLFIHADNWCQCDFQGFLTFHKNQRPDYTMMTMMTFRSESPGTCGVVEIDSHGVVSGYHEKVRHPPGNLANAAVYLLEPEIIQWLIENPNKTDFSTQVIPEFLGYIATWENRRVHRDIGRIDSLLAAQCDPQPELCWLESDEWQRQFKNNEIHQKLHSLTLP